jgi:hypothetical protein
MVPLVQVTTLWSTDRSARGSEEDFCSCKGEIVPAHQENIHFREMFGLVGDISFLRSMEPTSGKRYTRVRRAGIAAALLNRYELGLTKPRPRRAEQLMALFGSAAVAREA